MELKASDAGCAVKLVLLTPHATDWTLCNSLKTHEQPGNKDPDPVSSILGKYLLRVDSEGQPYRLRLKL